MYCHANVTIHDKNKLYDAVRECSKNSIASFNFLVSEPGNDKFLLTDFQRGRLSVNGIATITCFHDQITQYAGNCINKDTLLKIIAGENP
jgi:hypothetical protein